MGEGETANPPAGLPWTPDSLQLLVQLCALHEVQRTVLGTIWVAKVGSASSGSSPPPVYNCAHLSFRAVEPAQGRRRRSVPSWGLCLSAELGTTPSLSWTSLLNGPCSSVALG